MKRAVLITGLFLLSLLAAAQQKYEHLNQFWSGYYNSIKITQRWSINTDLQERTTDWFHQWLLLIGRTGVTYKIKDKFSLSAGFADFLSFGKGDKASRNEYRPWIEFGISDSHKQLKISHRFRAEDRFFQLIVNDELINRYSSNYRFRYRIDFQYPLISSETGWGLTAQFGNEVMLNAGNAIVYNYFDQNRTWVGLLYTVNKNFGLQVVYTNIFQQLSNGITLDRANVIRFNIYHTLDLIKDDNSTK